jgi:hypothetical protein
MEKQRLAFPLSQPRRQQRMVCLKNFHGLAARFDRTAESVLAAVYHPATVGDCY